MYLSAFEHVRGLRHRIAVKFFFRGKPAVNRCDNEVRESPRPIKEVVCCTLRIDSPKLTS